MKKRALTMAAAATLTIGLGATVASAGGKDKWVCMVDGAPVKVKGKDAKEQKKACEAKGGSWEKPKAAAQPAPSPEPPSGGGW